MNFTNINMFENRMQQQNMNTAFFQIEYHNCQVECAYSKIQRKFLFAIVDHNIGFTCSLNGTYANGYINHREAVETLMHCRVHGTFDPLHFYEFLNNQLPNVNISEVNITDYQRIASQAISAFEDRIYFNHWRRANMSERQKNKTIELMGYNVVEFCENNGLTPVYYPTPTQRTLDAFNNFELDYNSNGLQQ